MSQTVVYEDNVEGFDINAVIKVVLESKGINPIYGIEVEYWSKLNQTYISCGIYDQNSVEINFVPSDDLIPNDKKTWLIIRIKNCTGN